MRQALFSVIVDVDNDLIDNRVAFAGRLDGHVVEFARTTGFTSGRARYASTSALRPLGDPEFIQFIDGDCQL